MKATQRDLRRYRKLRKGLEQYSGVSSGSTGLRSISNGHGNINTMSDYRATSNEEESVCEKASWAELAYSGFLWWASAGEKRHDNNVEEDGDGVAPAIGRIPHEEPVESEPEDNIPVLDGPADDERDGANNDGHGYRRGDRDSDMPSIPPETPGLSGPTQSTSSGVVEMDIIAYFHRLTAWIIEGMSEAIESHGFSSDGATYGMSPDNEDASERRGLLDGSGFQHRSASDTTRTVDVWFSRDEMASLGLDRWSSSDEIFLAEMGRKWWRREIGAEKGGLCGLMCC